MLDLFARPALRKAGGLICLLAVAIGAGDDEETSNVDRLGMTKGVVCEAVRGYRDYDELPDAKLTRDDKLTIYCEPTGYKIEPEGEGKGFRAHIRTDGRLRRKGRKEVIYEQKKMVDYKVTSATRPERIYLKTVLMIKSLSPGEYELDMTLQDVLGDDRTRVQTVTFEVVATKVKPAEKED